MRYGNLGNAHWWASTWAGRGGYVSRTPAVGTIACFQPGVDEADAGTGHVAVVVAAGNGTVTVSEMNGPNGPGHTDDRVCSVVPGVSFLYAEPPTTPKDDDDMAVLATTGTRPAGETPDPRGNGAVYLVWGGFKRWLDAPAALPEYEQRYGDVEDWSATPYCLDRLIEVLPPIADNYVTITADTAPPPG